MGTIFETQDWLRIKLTYSDGTISSSIASVVIKYEKPDGTTGSWTATHDSTNKAVYYDLPLNGELGTSTATIKRWKFWIGATADDGRYAPGEVATELIKAEGSDR